MPRSRRKRQTAIKAKNFEKRDYSSLLRSQKNCLRIIEEEEAVRARYQDSLREHECLMRVYHNSLHMLVGADQSELVAFKEEREKIGFFDILFGQEKIKRLDEKIERKQKEIAEKMASLSRPLPPRSYNYNRVDRAKKILLLLPPLMAAAKKSHDALMNVRAMADAYKGKARALAMAIKNQLSTFEYCPYCCLPLGDDPHADHIQPISAGGLSVESNMIYVCRACNSKKSSLTLREFCLKNSLNRDEIEQRLVVLGKRV